LWFSLDRLYGKDVEMNVEVLRRCVCIAFTVVQVFTASSSPTESDVRAVEAELMRLERELSDVRAENRLLETRQKALGITADLMSGRRTVPPLKQTVEKLVLCLCEQPIILDNRATGEAEVWKRWLELTGGRRYRVRATLAVDEISGTGNFKFGAMVTQPGKSPKWPAADIGGQPISERVVYFDFFCPEGGSVLLLIGFETGKGLSSFSDVRISELAEVLK
jgi:hypothetical protein